ncbi:MAG: hypothetical protein EBR79_02325 [Proteobacteria bacterium]|nr:hypothetical protein [Pseudomonadota bacterium]NBX85631.1 hypothetical protein [Pseudomonadota bacterium]
MGERLHNQLAVVVLAAGKGTRMKSELPKVLHPLQGMPMLGRLLRGLGVLKPARVVVVTGYGAEQVEAYARSVLPGVEFSRQTEQRGTGHAVMMAEQALADFNGQIMIVYGDIMLAARADALQALRALGAENVDGLSMLTAEVDNPTGFGRLLQRGGVLVNVEEKDCTPEQRAVTTVNPCMYVLPAALLWQLLAQVQPNNVQKELYLTDIIELAAKAGRRVEAAKVVAQRPEVGVNTPEELVAMEGVLRQVA